MIKNFKLRWLPWLILTCIFVGCGDDSQTPLNFKGQIPTSQNISHWVKDWKNQRWIVATKPLNAKNKEQQIRSAFLLQNAFGYGDVSLKVEVVKPFATFPVQDHIMAVNKFMGFLKGNFEGSEQQPQFHIVSFSQKKTASMELLKLPPPDNTTLMQWARVQYDTLKESYPENLWIEPDLYAPVPSSPKSIKQHGLLPDSENIKNTAHTVNTADAGNASPGLQKIKWPEANAMGGSTNASTVVVAVMDTGVDYLHPALVNRMWNNPYWGPGAVAPNTSDMEIGNQHGIDATIAQGLPQGNQKSTGPYTPGESDVPGPGRRCAQVCANGPCGQNEKDLNQSCGHGTHVAGIIAGEAGATAGVTCRGSESPALIGGVCPSCQIIAIRVADTSYNSNGTPYDDGIADSSQIRAFSYLFNLTKPGRPLDLVVNVINASIGKFWRSRSMEFIVSQLISRGVILTAAAGNENTDLPSYPGAYDGVLSVCALGSFSNSCGDNDKAPFSNFGDWISLCAPGVNIVSTLPGASCGSEDGTSQAAPFVAGSAAYAISYFKSQKTPEQIRKAIVAGANSDVVYGSQCNKGVYKFQVGSNTQMHLLGSGLLDLQQTLSYSQQSEVSLYEGVAGVQSGCMVGSAHGAVHGVHYGGEAWPLSMLSLMVIFLLIMRLKRQY